ncbi:hypothetical protein [Pelistega ratti]|uniref:hypothetical protein n=1 Tax=Pelistega ratti TaxID=2652177 RepID=UPI001358ACF4|nr:hypothetical protein [Pelistega ratti]
MFGRFNIIDTNFASGTYGSIELGSFWLPNAKRTVNDISDATTIYYDQCQELRLISVDSESEELPKTNKLLWGGVGALGGSLGAAIGVGAAMFTDLLFPPKERVVAYKMRFIVLFKDGRYFIADDVDSEDYFRMIRMMGDCTSLEVYGQGRLVRAID